ncbi:MAG: hypothetical protein MK171_09065 [Pirellulales bacterium]|nr:hypothetical protein [Pirellulales bacterium]
MKKERRHDLETNFLAVKLTQWIAAVRPYSKALTGLVALAIGLFAVTLLWNSRSASTERSAWEEFAIASNTYDPELMKLQDLATAEEYAGTRMQEWAHAAWADGQVLLAAGSYLSDREAAQTRLRNVVGTYVALATSAGDSDIRNRSHFGLGRIYELQNKIDQAQREYALVQGDLQTLALERAEQLKSDKVKEACNWLFTAALPKRDLTGGQGATGARPSFDVAVPDSAPAGDATEGPIATDSSETGASDVEAEVGEPGAGGSTASDVAAGEGTAPKNDVGDE